MSDNIDSATTDATRDMADDDPFHVLFFISAGSTFLVARRFEGRGPHTNQGTERKPGQPYAKIVMRVRVQGFIR